MDRKAELTINRSAECPPGEPAVQAYIALGSNLGEHQRNIRAAVERVNQVAGVRVTKISSFYETEPVGGPPQEMYLNAVVKVESSISARQLLAELQRIENDLGRTRPGKNFPRTIDLDILLYGGRVIDEPGLRVPHPGMHNRLFVLDPLNEIAPDVIHPVLGLTIADLRKALRSALAISDARKP